MSIREDRLKSELMELKNFRSRVVTWTTIGDKTPPDHFHFQYNLKSIVGFSSSGNPKYHTGFEVEFKFPSTFPRTKPEVRFTKKPWPCHPNIYSDGHICMEGQQNWIPGVGVPLTSMCFMVGQIIAFQEVNLSSPASSNEDLKRWIKNNLRFSTKTRVINPVDDSPIRSMDLSDAIAWGDSPRDDQGPRIKFG